MEQHRTLAILLPLHQLAREAVDPLQTSIELISHTTYKEGLTVTAVKDSHFYRTGIKVSDEELASLHIARDAFHGEWNYTFEPQEPLSKGHLI